MIDFTAIRRLRDEIRLFEGGSTDPKVAGGQCYWVAEALHVEHGVEIRTGCYHGTGKHIYHAWVELPGGLYLDSTVDQFGDDDDVRVTSSRDARYVLDCPLEGTEG